MSITGEKRKEFFDGKTRYRGPNRVIILSFALVIVVGIAIFVQSTRKVVAVPKRWQGGTYNIGRSMDYKNQVISMTDIPLRVENGQILVDVNTVVEKKLVYIDYPKGREAKALTALITPAGRLVVAIAKCEPCRSQRFHIEGNILVCDTCGTRWLLNDLQGLSGGCPQYPPEELPYTVQNGLASVDEKYALEWKPRI